MPPGDTGDPKDHQHTKAQQTLTAFPFPPEVLEICKTLKRAGFSCYLVGGSVRDIILGKTPEDFDLATNALPQESVDLFQKTIPTGLQYGTVTVRKGGKNFELTTFRGDGAYHDGRRPEVVSFKNDIMEDLARRDFTINAMAYDPLAQRLVDGFGGVFHLETGIIRTVGPPEDRLLEDGLRIMRAFRFMRFGKLHPELLAATRENRKILLKISAERIRMEFVKILSQDDPVPVLEAMAEAKIFEMVFRPLGQLCKNPELWTRLMACLRSLDDKDHLVKHAVLFFLISFPEAGLSQGMPELFTMQTGKLKHQLHASERHCSRLLHTWCYSKKERNRVCSLVQELWLPPTLLTKEAQAPGKLRMAKIQFAETIFPNLRILRAWEKAGATGGGREKELETLEQNLCAISTEGHEEPLFSGKDIMAHLEISPSRNVGILKNELYRYQVEEDCKDREVLLGKLTELWATRKTS